MRAGSLLDVYKRQEVAFASDVTVEQFNIYENKAWGNVTGYNVQCFVNGEWKTVYEGTETSPEDVYKRQTWS